MIEKNIRLEPHHSRDLLVGRRSDGRRPGYQPPGRGGRSGGPPSQGGGGRNGPHAPAPAPAPSPHRDPDPVPTRTVTTAKAPPSILAREVKPAHLGDTGGSLKAPIEYITKKPPKDTGPKDGPKPHEGDWEPGWLNKDLRKNLKTLEDPNKNRREKEQARVWLDQHNKKIAASQKPSGIMSKIGGIGKKVLGDNPLEWAVNIASLGGYQKAKYAKALIDIKKGQGIYGKAFNLAKKGLDKSNITSTIDKAKATKFRDERTTLGKEDIENWERRQNWSAVKPPKSGDGDGPKTIAEQVTKGAGLEEGQKMLGIDEIKKRHSLLQNTLNDGFYVDNEGRTIQLNDQQKATLTNYITQIDDYLVNIDTRVMSAYGGRIDKALTGRSRDI